MKSLKTHILNISRLFDSSSLRQRVIVAAAIFIAIHAAWDFSIYQPQLQELSRIEAAINLDKANIEKLKKGFDRNSSYALASQIGDATEIKRQIRKLEMQIALSSNEFIPPSQMPAVLQKLLKNNDRLRVTGLTSEPATILNISSDDKTEESPLTPIYKHAMTIRFEGDYLSALDYIRDIENSDQRIFWDSVSINSDDYPETRVSISLFTLSLNEGWIGV